MNQPTELAPHGTRKRYFQELHSNTGTCQACRKAAAAYMRDWRSKGGEAVQAEADRNNATIRALWRLAHQHPDEFQALAAEERVKGRAQLKVTA